MRRKLVAVVLLMLAAAFAVGASVRSMLIRENTPLGVGVRAPHFTAMTLDDIPEEKSLDDYRGSVLLINIWATWCAPCREEMPALDRLQAALGGPDFEVVALSIDRGGADAVRAFCEQLHRAYGPRGLKVVAVSVDDAGMEPQIRSFVKEYGLTFEVLHDPGGQLGEVSRAFQVAGYPETVIVGRDGLIRKRLLGMHDWNSAGNRALVERLLEERTK